MINEQIVRDLRVIFSDAELMDIDFSHWDAALRLCVIADHFPGQGGKPRPVLMLSFQGVTKMDISFHHHDFTQYPWDWSTEDHLSWPIYRSEIKQDSVSKLILSGSEQFPILTIEFGNVDIVEIDRSIMAEVNPAWNKARAGLARPGIMDLHRLMSGTNKKAKQRRGAG